MHSGKLAARNRNCFLLKLLSTCGRRGLLFVILSLQLQLVTLSSFAQYTKLLDFGSRANGTNPYSNLFSDGTFLYGMTSDGGTNDVGTIYKIKADGTGFAKLLDFDGTNGGNPYGSLISDGTFLYGMTYRGGSNGQGTIFKIKPDGSGFAKLLDFVYVANGGFPFGSLVYDGTFLYGMTSQGGSKFYGTIFKIMPDGTGFAKLREFDYTNDGGYPYGSLFYDNTFLYGMTNQGGTNGIGTIVKIKPDGTGFAKLFDFSGPNDGSRPNGSLISDGTFLYGMTTNGGSGNYGAIFKILPDGSGFAKILDFDNSIIKGAYPKGSLVFDAAKTFLYGTTTDYGLNSRGTIFKVMPDGTGFVNLLDNDVGTNGTSPEGTLIFSGSSLYGVKSGGGAGLAPFFPGTIFKIDPTGTGYTKLFTFEVEGHSPSGSLNSDGTFLYGMTSAGGLLDYGTLFKIKPDGTGFVRLLDFNGAANGSRPVGRPTYDGIFLYGMTSQGGANDVGTIFKIKPDGTSYLKLLDFDNATSGGNPNGSLITNGTSLYGMTTNGGPSNYGSIFTINNDGTGFVNLLDLDYTNNGAFPNGSLLSTGGFLYGLTSQGGSTGFGALFKVAMNGTGIIKLVDFDDTNGANPYGSLVTDGTFLYGMTSSGGLNGNGTIFKVRTDGTGFITLLDFDDKNNGGLPHGSLTLIGSTLYGMTAGGGLLGFGVLFSIKTDGSGYAKILDFNDGRSPLSSLISDGTFLYGMTSAGGANGLGILFKTSLTPFPTITDFSPADGVEGTMVTINGTNFDPTPANNIVKFNNATATVISGTSTTLTAIVPVGATSGPISVTAGITATSITDFNVTSVAVMFNGTVRNCNVEFVEPGGSDDVTETFLPINPSDKVRVSFSSFDVGDILYVYDGPTTASPLIATLSGSTVPGDIVATGPGGELTFLFSWQDNTSTWDATISCHSPSSMSNGTVQACNVVFLDPGGSGDYPSSQNITETFMPVIAGDKLTVSFSSFSTESCCDSLYVYDGPTIASPLVAALAGDTLISAITATGPGGELTFLFRSDTDVEGAGWVAFISCPTASSTIAIAKQPSDFVGCAGDVATFSTSAVGTTNITYQWQYSPDGINYTDITNGSGYSNATTATLSVNTIGNFGSGRYRCRINGDLAAEVITFDEGLFLNPTPPAPTTVSPGLACGPASVDLTASGGINGEYVWYTTQTGGTPIPGQNNDVYTTPTLSATTTFYVSINDGTCESTRTPAIASIQTCNAPTIASTVSTAFIEGIVTIDLTNLISDPENNLDLSSLQIIAQPASGAPASLSGLILTIDYSGFLYTSTDVVSISVCDLTDLCTFQQVAIEFAGDITIYNAVSPNGDGKNEFLYLQYIEVIPGKKQNQVRIYNRWGDEVFSISDYNNQDRVFKGNNNDGNKLPTGTYFFKISFASGEKSRTGYLELKY